PGPDSVKSGGPLSISSISFLGSFTIYSQRVLRNSIALFSFSEVPTFKPIDAETERNNQKLRGLKLKKYINEKGSLNSQAGGNSSQQDGKVDGVQAGLMNSELFMGNVQADSKK
ncbi:hypothetical protein Tco_0504502, partial [Tanacetum coccineum]